MVREDFGEQMYFFAAAGFRNAWQSWGAHLKLARFKFSPFRTLEERLFLEGYEVELLSNDAPPADWEALHALSREAVHDAPQNPTTTPDDLRLEKLRELIRREETVFVARHKHQIVAFTRLTLRRVEAWNYDRHGVGMMAVLSRRSTLHTESAMPMAIAGVRCAY
ncbi:hypothetical protein [Deinococcus alpinitundrae]|uniref:hypothetical protein n=1 Tax=Deinococcus alpinitundrae TaxID=468913 RepID=UPI00137B0F85|nr:hypothetical protein [Deinococcus alpinitundrae]